MCTITQLPKKPCGIPNVSGLVDIWIIEKENVSIGSVTDGGVAAVTVVATKFFKKLSGLINQAEDKNDHSLNLETDTDYFENTLMLKYPYRSKELFNALQTYTGGVELFVIVKDGNGKKFIYGDDTPVRLSTSIGGSQKGIKGQFNGLDLTFVQQNAGHFPYEYTGTDASLPIA